MRLKKKSLKGPNNLPHDRKKNQVLNDFCNIFIGSQCNKERSICNYFLPAYTIDRIIIFYALTSSYCVIKFPHHCKFMCTSNFSFHYQIQYIEKRLPLIAKPNNSQ